MGNSSSSSDDEEKQDRRRSDRHDSKDNGADAVDSDDDSARRHGAHRSRRRGSAGGSRDRDGSEGPRKPKRRSSSSDDDDDDDGSRQRGSHGKPPRRPPSERRASLSRRRNSGEGRRGDSGSRHHSDDDDDSARRHGAHRDRSRRRGSSEGSRDRDGSEGPRRSKRRSSSSDDDDDGSRQRGSHGKPLRRHHSERRGSKGRSDSVEGDATRDDSRHHHRRHHTISPQPSNGPVSTRAMFSTLRGDEAGVNSKAVKAVTDFLASETTTRAHTVLIRMTDEEGRTALHFATARNMGQAVSDLLRHGADPEAATNSLTRITALHIASQRGLVDIVTTLLSAQYRKQAIRGALSVASANGHSDIVALLIAAARDAADEEHSNEHAKAGQRTATTTSTATTSPLWRSGTLPPLHAAASRGRRTIVRQLLLAGSGANSLSAGSTGYTALSLACKGAHVDVVRDLLLAGADPNVQNIQLRSKSMSDKPENAPSALALAAASSSEACVNLLLSNPIPAKITFEALSTKTSGTIRSILRAARRPDAAPVDVAASGRVASSSSKSSYSWACDMIDGADLTMVRKVGEGTTKIVWQADMRTGAGPVTVAAMLFKDPDYDSCKLSLHHEALTMALPYHPNVAGLVGVCAERKCIVTEFVNGDVVYDKLHTPPEPTWPLLKRMMLVRDIVRGLSFLHTHGVSHGDLSSRNVMTEASSGTAKLIDFGCARVRSGLGNLGLIRRGAPLWMPPEVLSAPEVQEASSLDVYAVDVYSFGILAHEVLSGAVPFMSRDSDDDPLTWDAVRRLVCDDGAKPDMSLVRAKAVPEHAVDLMLRCLAPLPSDRPTAVSLEREWELLVQATVDGGGAPALLECVVCLDAPRSSALGCGHAVCCSPCARSLRHRGLGCPVCRACVSRVVNVSSRDVTKTYDPSLLS